MEELAYSKLIWLLISIIDLANHSVPYCINGIVNLQG